MIKQTLFAITILALTACSSKNSEKADGIGAAITTQLKGTIAARKAAKSGVKPAAPKPFTFADVAATKVELIRIEIPKFKSFALAQFVRSNEGYKTYFTAAQQSVTLKGAELTATRGFGHDLMARSVGDSERTYRYLDALNHLRKFEVNCVSTPAGTEDVKVLDKTFRLRKIEEICRNETKAFKNVKWVSASGKTRKATQWAGHEVGFIIIEWLD
jgi:hypothetical protein